MSIHATTTEKKPKKPKLHTPSRHGTRLPSSAMKDAWNHKGQAKGQ